MNMGNVSVIFKIIILSSSRFLWKQAVNPSLKIDSPNIGHMFKKDCKMIMREEGILSAQCEWVNLKFY